MKRIVFVLLTVFVFFSCENDDLASKIDESNDLYVFRGIEYFLEEGDSLTATILQSEPDTVENTVVFSFCPDQQLPYILCSNGSLMIPIPESIEDGKIILSSAIWKYTEEKVECPDVAKELCVTYVATFSGIVTGNEMKLKGKWRSECIRHNQKKVELAADSR